MWHAENVDFQAEMKVRTKLEMEGTEMGFQIEWGEVGMECCQVEYGVVVAIGLIGRNRIGHHEGSAGFWKIRNQEFDRKLHARDDNLACILPCLGLCLERAR
jgi:hypothetical protein